jgi:hypothetical protein
LVPCHYYLNLEGNCFHFFPQLKFLLASATKFATFLAMFDVAGVAAKAEAALKKNLNNPEGTSIAL